jgi:uncharacterized tellurite resistance protein B-like protein
MLFNKKAELNVLINLAAIDRIIDAKEVKLIHMIGKANGFGREEVDEMIKHPQTIINMAEMTADEKFEHLYYLITLMKSDGKIFQNEIDFCEKVADRLGYRKGVIGAMSQHIYSDIAVRADRELLRKKSDQYLKV